MHVTASRILEKRKHTYANGIIYHDETVTIKGVTEIVSQYFTKHGSDRKYGYYPNALAFLYEINHYDYQDPIFTQIWTPTLISNPTTFTGFEDLWSNAITIDGGLYHILSETPIPVWTPQNYIGGFTNKDFDLDKVLVQLKKFSWIRNIVIEEIPYYNRAEDRTHGIYFEYCIPEVIFRGLWNQFKNAKYPLTTIKDQFNAYSAEQGQDLLGIKPFAKKQPSA